jgi:hypothetical protein
MNIGPLESLVLLLFVVSLLGPVLAGAYLASRLHRRRREVPRP